MKELVINPTFVKQFQHKFPLIHKDAVQNVQDLSDEGEIVHLVDGNGGFIAKGYYGKQNKGLGWVLTHSIDEPIDVTFFRTKILTAINKRKAYYEDPNTTAFRLFNGEGDGIGGLTIDYYNGHYLLNWYSEGIYAFKEKVVTVLTEYGECESIYEKKRFDTKGSYIDDDDFVYGERPEFPLIIQENGMNYAVDLNDGAMTGIFLDQRDVRRALRDRYAKGKHVLNTFSYTGAFSVAAALGGAESTTSVDLAKRSEPKTIENFSLNGIDLEQQSIYVMDIYSYFKYAKRHSLMYDTIVLDPPSFARNKKKTFSSAKDYPSLIKHSAEIINDGGIIVASTNNASFDMKHFKKLVAQGFKEAGVSYNVKEEFGLPRDFPAHSLYKQSDYLKVLVLEV
ncbi:23S rRNA (cytosine1962-C5)-methyltransferase [Alkalibacillus flavidus]|uniref:23S rRNA (Cytosine1962-C5)-methyltransferase n=1 Tax=Alkalibacillus flavidus TaxID=546021 RepID=A0ABV2KXR6_9BACI